MADLMNMISEFPEFQELDFDEKNHIYMLDSIRIPSVSEILEPLKCALYAGITEKTLERAANKGSSVHDSIENWIKFGIEDVVPEYKGYFQGFREWWEKNKPVVVGSECRVYHKTLRYGGTVDLLCYIENKLTLIDFKTTANLNDMTCGVQLEGYAQALASHGIKVEENRILHLQKRGKHNERVYLPNDAVRWRTFGSLKTVYDYIQSFK